MTISQVINHIEEYHPNTVSLSLKLRWINEAEGYIQREVMLLKDAALRYQYSENDMDTVLLAPMPYDRLYIEYLDAQLFYLYHEISDYENSAERYNETVKDYAAWYARMYAPARAKNRWRRHGEEYEPLVPPTPEPPQPVDDGYNYYTGLEAAIADLNNGLINPDSEKGSAAVKIERETKTVTLLANATDISDRIILASDMTLNLAGRSIISPVSYLFRYEGGEPIEVEINGPGEINVTGDSFAGVVQWGIQDSIAPAESKLTVNGGVYVSTGTQTMSNCISMMGGQLFMKNAEVHANGSGSAGTFVIGVIAQNGAVCELEGCTIQGYFTGDGNAHTVGIYNNGAEVTIKNCEISVDAPYKCYAQESDKCVDTDGILARTANGYTTLTKLYNCNVIGMHSGVSNQGTLYIDGGNYQSKGHGGLYAQGSSINYVKNATLQEGDYTGQFIAVDNGAVLYMREHPIVYLDSVILPASASWTQWAVMATCTNARLYMSNISMPTDRHRFIRMDQSSLSGNANKIYSGENCDFDDANFYIKTLDNEQHVIFLVVDAATKAIFDQSGDTAIANETAAAAIAARYEKTSDNYAWEEI